MDLSPDRFSEEQRRWARENTEAIDRLPCEVAKLVLGNRAVAGEELRLGEESRAVLVAEPDEGWLSVTVEVHFPPELVRRITEGA